MHKSTYIYILTGVTKLEDYIMINGKRIKKKELDGIMLTKVTMTDHRRPKS